MTDLVKTITSQFYAWRGNVAKRFLTKEGLLTEGPDVACRFCEMLYMSHVSVA